VFRPAVRHSHGKSTEHELPVGMGRGFLWRINSYWHIEQKDGGVYLQVETMALTRSVPVACEWIMAPFLKSIPWHHVDVPVHHAGQGAGAQRAFGEAAATADCE